MATARTDTPSQRREHRRHMVSAHRRRAVRRYAIAIAAVLLVAFVGDAGWAGLTALRALSETRDALTDGGDRLVDGKLDTAAATFDLATIEADRAVSALGHPSISLLRLMPFVGDDVDAVRRSARASRLAAEAGSEYVAGARELRWDGGSVPGFEAGGRVDTTAIEAAAPSVRRAADLLSEARGELDPVDTAKLAGPLSALIEDARTQTQQRADQARRAATLAGLLPAFLGADGSRTYLLVTLTPSDPRAAGGYPGVYGILRADGEHLTLDSFAPTSTIPQVPPIAAPAEVRRNYARLGALKAFWATTYTPDFPTAARLMEGIWEAAGGEPVDGVIAGDLRLLAELLGALGPVETPVWPEPITADNAEQILGVDVYRTVVGERADRWQVGIANAVWAAALSRPWPAAPIASALSSAAAERHLQMWSEDQEEADMLSALGVSGEVRFAAADPPLVTLNGSTPNRVGYFLDMNVGSDSTDRPDGGRDVRVTVSLENTAPAGPPSMLLASSRRDTAGYPLGTFGGSVNVYLPPGATLENVAVEGGPQSALMEYTEFGHPVASQFTFVRPGTTVDITYRYTVPPE